MTYFAPLTERILAALRTAAPGSYAPHGPAERYDFEVARAMSVEERLDRLDEILRFAERQGAVVGSTQPIRHGALRI
jgi:hypothetical protein